MEIVVQKPLSLPQSCCGNCRHWFFREDLKPQRPGEFETGECRRHPPTLFATPVQTLQGPAIGYQTLWPAPFADKVCGEFAKKAALLDAGPET